MRKNYHLFIFLLGLAVPNLMVAQVKQQLSLKEALLLAEENNLTAKSAEARELAARGQYRMTNSVFLPGVTVSTTGVATNDPLSAFGFKLKQEIVSPADFDPAKLNDPDRTDNFNTKLEVQQPLINLDGFYARKAAKNQYEAMSLQTKRAKANIRFEVKKAYYMLELAENAVAVLKTSVTVAEDALRLTKDFEQQGFAKQADVLEAMVRADERKNQLREAENNLQTANEFLAHLLGLDLGTPIEATDSMSLATIPQLAASPDASLENRSDFQAIQKQIQGAENMLKSEKMKFLPRVNAFGAYEWNDSKLLGTSANNYMVGASLSWNLFGGYKNIGSTEHAKAQLMEARFSYQDYLSQSQIQVNRAIRNAEIKFDQVQTGKLAKEQAGESYRIRNDRFKQGLEKSTDLLMAEALSAQKSLEYIQSIYYYQEAIFQLEFLLETTINE